MSDVGHATAGSEFDAVRYCRVINRSQHHGLLALSELIAQREALERQIRDAQSTAKADAVAQARRLISEYGLTAADLFSKAPVRAAGAERKKVAPKYKDPSSGATWTGRGLKPKWLQSAIDAGKSLSDFVI